MQVTVTASVTFEVTNPPKGPNAKDKLERVVRQRISDKVIDGTFVVETDLGKHEVSVIETFVHGYNLAPVTPEAKWAYRPDGL